MRVKKFGDLSKYPRYIVWNADPSDHQRAYFLLELINFYSTFTATCFDLMHLYSLEFDDENLIKDNERTSTGVDIFESSLDSMVFTSNDLQECIDYLEEIVLKRNMKKYNL